eukprot:TRINITY_DN45440_c0_g1_i1.p1 TRINITY_DN45440_c0_g1~~TRINITY_DN45440_c0_g1_i1.p1  ORF type:complete len:314 (-),score=3.82 TRINITY_DN45440_c0_g1_i1:96-1037(-)
MAKLLSVLRRSGGLGAKMVHLCMCMFALSQGLPFDPQEARNFAALSSVPYCDALDSVRQWECPACLESNIALQHGKVEVIDAGDYNSNRILIAKLRDETGCIVSFRGSDDMNNWIRNLEAWKETPKSFDDCDGCLVHRGFYEAWVSVRNATVDALSRVGCNTSSRHNALMIAGHSFGGALTHLAMFNLETLGFRVVKAYSFEAPRVGNKVFSDKFAARFSNRSTVYRITHHMDPVVHLPPAFGFTHVQTEVYYAPNGDYKVCQHVEDPSCADQFQNLPDLLLFHRGEHCKSPLVKNGDICNPFGCARLKGLIV